MGEINPKNQTNEEWLADYDGLVTTMSSSIASNKIDKKLLMPITLFRYISHKTTCLGAVALTFQSLDGKIEVIKFFNVSLKGKKSNYPAKLRGQFNPPERGKFRKFWIQSVGQSPSRWCRVHKSMRSSLKGLVFTGTYDTAYDKKGHPYMKFSEVSLYEPSTTLAQTGH